jgi:SAM-dependent methyltransferase
MPFKDKAFDFAIAFHVLEHARDPASFLQELSRVAKAGYIETPNVMFERLVPYDIHLLEIMDLEGRLYIQKKWSPATDTFGHQLEVFRRDPAWNRFFYTNPALFHVRYSWRDKILFEIVNPAENCSWFLDDESAEGDVANAPPSQHLRARGLKLMRHWYKARSRSTINLPDLLVCPECRNALGQDDGWLVCVHCQVRYPSEPWPNFSRPSASQPRTAQGGSSAFDHVHE